VPRRRSFGVCRVVSIGPQDKRRRPTRRRLPCRCGKSLIRGWHFKNITATDFTLRCPAVKGLGLYYKHLGAPVPLYKHLGGRFIPKNSAFRRRVEKVGLKVRDHIFCDNSARLLKSRAGDARMLWPEAFLINPKRSPLQWLPLPPCRAAFPNCDGARKITDAR
jgi:hypothetical protein